MFLYSKRIRKLQSDTHIESYAQAVAESVHGVRGHIVVKRWMEVAAVHAMTAGILV